ncbi:MAG: c-type cytochrome [Nitrospirota bacterium]|nr:c-type cytochrome [Nitrospirota bacterium]
MKLKHFAIAALAVTFAMSSAAAMAAEKDPLKPRAPASAKGEKNPVPASADSIATGEELFQEIGCNGCHGDAGTGDGPASAGMEPGPRNFTNAAWQGARADGELKHTIFAGSDGTAMIANEAMFDEPEDVWHVVNYLRSLKK